VIGGFIEAIKHPERFVAALDRAAGQGKPVVMLKVGRTRRTQYAVATHTGGAAGDPGHASELLRAHHAIEVFDLVEFTEAIAAAQSTKSAAGRRLGVVTSSGGLAEMILDIAASTDLLLPPFIDCGKGRDRAADRLCQRRREPARRLGQWHFPRQPAARSSGF
jgi:acyl-CoA synthetase (NDP forming)